MSPRALRLLLLGLSLQLAAALYGAAVFVIPESVRFWTFLPVIALAVVAVVEARRAVAEMGFPDPDEALDQVAAMQRARDLMEAEGDPPEPEFAVSILHHLQDQGLKAMFVRELGPRGEHVFTLEIDAGRGKLRIQREGSETWRDRLTRDDLDLLPPGAVRALQVAEADNDRPKPGR